MPRKAKNPPQKLTAEDEEILEKVVIKYAVKFYALMEKYPNPKQYAKEVIIKELKSNGNIATLYTIGYAKNLPSGRIFRPGQLNNALTSNIRQTIRNDFITLSSEDKEFLSPRDLREKVLEKLENYGIFIHLRRKKEIRHYENHFPGRKISSRDQNDRGGRPSAYKLTDEIERLKKTLEKPESINFLYNKIIRSGLAQKLTKYNLLAFFHAAKIDEGVLHGMMGVGAAYMKDNITEEDTATFNHLYHSLQSLDDSSLEQYVDNIAASLVENRGYYVFLFMAGMLEF